MRRSAVVVASPATKLTPYDRNGRLPSWNPVPPAGGWTPAAAWEAALDYARTNSSYGNPASLSKNAYRALLISDPHLSRADIEARLKGQIRAEWVESNPQDFPEGFLRTMVK